MVKINSKKISWIITLAIITLFAWYFFSNIKDFSLLLSINPVFVVLLIIINILAITMNGIFMKWSISLFGKYISYNESVRVSLVSSAGNFFAPAGSGLGFRAIYLKKRHGLSYSDYLAIIFCNYVIVFFISSLLGLVSLYILREHASPSFIVLALFFFTLLTTSFSAFFIRTKTSSQDIVFRAKWVNRIFEILGQISKGWVLILANKRIAVRLVGIVIVNSGLMVLGAYFIMKSLGLVLSPANLLLFSILGSLSVFINITPGNLGVKEAVFIAFSAIIGLTTPQILSVALVDRVVMFVVLFLLWLIYGRNLHSSISQKLES